MTEPIKPRWVGTKTAALHIGLHPDTLRRLRGEGGGPPYARVGAAVRYDLRELDRWMSARTFSSTAEEASRS